MFDVKTKWSCWPVSRLLSCAEKVCELQPKECSRVVKTRTWLRWCKRLFASGQTEGGNRCCCTYTQKCRNNKVMICIIYLMNMDWPNRMGGFGHIAHPYWHDWVIVGISRCICVKSWVNVYRYQIGENAFLGTGIVSLTQSCNARKGRYWQKIMSLTTRTSNLTESTIILCDIHQNNRGKEADSALLNLATGGVCCGMMELIHTLRRVHSEPCVSNCNLLTGVLLSSFSLLLILIDARPPMTDKHMGKVSRCSV